jgi:hypothetical protein
LNLRVYGRRGRRYRIELDGNVLVRDQRDGEEPDVVQCTATDTIVLVRLRVHPAAM